MLLEHLQRSYYHPYYQQPNHHHWENSGNNNNNNNNSNNNDRFKDNPNFEQSNSNQHQQAKAISTGGVSSVTKLLSQSTPSSTSSKALSTSPSTPPTIYIESGNRNSNNNTDNSIASTIFESELNGRHSISDQDQQDFHRGFERLRQHQSETDSDIDQNNNYIVEGPGQTHFITTAGTIVATNGALASVAAEEEARRRREALARRPSYRRILNDLSAAGSPSPGAPSPHDDTDELIRTSVALTHLRDQQQSHHILSQSHNHIAPASPHHQQPPPPHSHAAHHPAHHPPNGPTHPNHHPLTIVKTETDEDSEASQASGQGIPLAPGTPVSNGHHQGVVTSIPGAGSPFPSIKLIPGTTTIHLGPPNSSQDGQLNSGLQALTVTNAQGHHPAPPGHTLFQFAPQAQDGQFYVPAYQIRGNPGQNGPPPHQGMIMGGPGPGGPGQHQSPGIPAVNLNASDDASKKRELRLLKNREAAKECRRKKKEYIKCLENRVAVLENQNKALIEELKSLKELYCSKE